MTGMAAAGPRKRLLACARILAPGLSKRAFIVSSVKRNGKKRKSIH